MDGRNPKDSLSTGNQSTTRKVHRTLGHAGASYNPYAKEIKTSGRRSPQPPPIVLQPEATAKTRVAIEDESPRIEFTGSKPSY